MFFSAALQGKNDAWRYIVTIVLVFLTIGVIGLKMASGEIDQQDLEAFQANVDFSALGIDSNLGVTLLLLSFAISLVVLWLCVKYLHLRPLRSLINGLGRIRWSRVAFAFGLWFSFSLITEFGSYLMTPENYSFEFNAAAFIPLLIISLTLLPLQTSFEELLFRGYLMQWIGRSGMIILVPLLLTSIGFGLMHGMNPEVAKFGSGTMMAYYIGSGLFLGIMTIMDDGLELALGTHAATNFFAATCVTFDEAALQTNALFRVQDINISAAMIGFVVLSLLFLAICAKKYNWTDWNRFFQKPQFYQNTPAEASSQFPDKA